MLVGQAFLYSSRHQKQNSCQRHGIFQLLAPGALHRPIAASLLDRSSSAAAHRKVAAAAARMERRSDSFTFGSAAATKEEDPSSMMECTTLTPSRLCRAKPFSTPQGRHQQLSTPSSIRNQHTPGTTSRAYTETVYVFPWQDSKEVLALSSISGMPHYASMSHEELRWADYQTENSGTAAAAAVPSSPFAHPAPPPSTPAPVRYPAKSGGTVVEYLAPESLLYTDAVAIGEVEYVVAPSTSSDDAAEECSICLEPLVAPSSASAFGQHPENNSGKSMRLTRCGHRFHVPCLGRALGASKRSTCPNCREVVGQCPTGKMPSGTMTIQTDATITCSPGGSTPGSILIRYDFPAGLQKAYHPAPGRLHQAAVFRAILPDNAQGRQLLQRLKEAFARGLTFLIGAAFPSQPNPIREWIPHKNYPLAANGFPNRSYMTACHSALDAVGVPRAEPHL